MSDASTAVEALDPLPPDRYQGLSNDSLLCYAVTELKSRSIPATFENVTVAAFRLFPEHFSLVGYVDHPDASRVNRTLLHARPKYRDLIIGNAKSGYALTSKGEGVARQVAADLQSLRRVPRTTQAAGPSSRRTYTGHAVVEQLEQSALYGHWRDAELDSIGDYEVWDFLEAMPYTDKTMLREILKNYREGAELASRRDLLKFLAWVSKRYRHVFQEGEGDR